MINQSGSDEIGYAKIITSNNAFIPKQLIVTPTNQEIKAGQICVIQYKQKAEHPNSLLVDAALKYRLENINASGSTLLIPTSGIWSLIRYLKIKSKSTIILQYDIDGILEDIYYSKLVTNFNSIKQFLNARSATANITALTDLDNTRTLASTNISPFYRSSFREVLDSLFRYRHMSFFEDIEIEFQMLDNISATAIQKAIGVGATGSSISDLKIRDIQLVLDISQFKESVPLLISSGRSDIDVNYFFKNNYPITANSAGTQIINFNKDFPPISVMNKAFIFFTNTTGSVGTLNSTNSYQIYNNSYITQLELTRDTVRIKVLNDSEIYDDCIADGRRRGRNYDDAFYTSNSFLTKAPTLYFSFDRSKSSVPLESSSSLNQLSTGISNNNANGLFLLNVSYDLTSAPTYLNQMTVLLSTSRIVSLFSNYNSKPEVSY